MTVNTLLFDIGGVLMTNGWDRHLRKTLSETFGIEYDEMNERHMLLFDLFERGKMSFDEFLDHVVFYKERSFSKEEFKNTVFNAVRPFPQMLDYVRALKKAGLRIGVLSNEGKELALDRIQRFHLTEFIDFFVISSFVHLRKPDPDIYRLALSLSQSHSQELLYIDDRPLLVEMAKSLGIPSHLHTGFENTRETIEKSLRAALT